MIELQPDHPFTWISQPWGEALQSEALSPLVRHLFTTRSLPLRGAEAADGWRALAASVGIDPSRLVRLKQVHGTSVAVVNGRSTPRARAVESTRLSSAPDGRDVSIDVGAIVPAWSEDGGFPHADVAMTADPSVAVVVQVADCVPLLLADRATGAVAAVHAGWRGTAAGVVARAVAAMREHFGTRAEGIVAAIGPSIHPCCYQVGGDVVEAFRAAGHGERVIARWLRPDPTAAGKFRLDVPQANVDQLRAAGVPPESIAACGLCTACQPALFYSYRREGATGRLAGVIRAGFGRN